MRGIRVTRPRYRPAYETLTLNEVPPSGGRSTSSRHDGHSFWSGYFDGFRRDDALVGVAHHLSRWQQPEGRQWRLFFRRRAVRHHLDGTAVGAIKHVWLIILENKSYDESFTGLNQNTYLWQTLPEQGALLTNYYGTGHFSMDNYISLVSGQAPSYGVQDDCSTTANMTNNNSGIITNGTVGTSTDTDGTTDAQWHQHHDTESDRRGQRQLRPAAGARRRERGPRKQRMRLPDRRSDDLQPVQRGRRAVEGLRPRPRWRTARRFDDLRHGPDPRRHRHRSRT